MTRDVDQQQGRFIFQTGQLLHVSQELLFNTMLSSGIEVSSDAFPRFKVASAQSTAISDRATIDYEVEMLGKRIRWRTRLTSVEQGRRFVEEQVDGPFLRWVHVCEFTPVEGGVLLSDTVRYDISGGPLGIIADAVLFRPVIELVFRTRRRTLAKMYCDGHELP